VTNDLRILRERQLVASDALDRAGASQDPYGSAAMCAITTTASSYPTAAGAFYACNPELLTGSVAEGATPTFTADTSTIEYAFNLGTAIPPVGTILVIHSVGGRWCFRFDG
jgi:hypothetical protein